jgi:hypothetical protein
MVLPFFEKQKKTPPWLEQSSQGDAFVLVHSAAVGGITVLRVLRAELA